MMGKVVFKFPATPSSSRPLLLLLTVVAVVTWTPQGVQGQANMDQSMTFWKLPEADKMVNLANYFATHDSVFRQVLNVAESFKWMEQGRSGSTVSDAAMPAVLEALPEVFNSSAFKLAVYLAFDELSRAAPTDRVTEEGMFNMTVEKTAPYNVSVFSPAFNDTLQKLTMQYMLSHASWPRAVNRFLSQMSARDLLYEASPQRPTVDPQCYSDTTDFLDAVIGATVVQGNMSALDSVQLKRYGWALKMLDSFGKVSGGVMKGAIHYVGSYDECRAVHAYIPNNSSILVGRRPHNYVTEFDGRFCRVNFDLPDAVIDSFGVDTRGITLRLHWGMCFPDSCRSDDVAAIFHLGMLKQYDIDVHSVYCVEDPDISDDTSAIVAIVLLTLLGGAVVLCTLVEALIQFHSNNCLRPSTPSSSSIEDPQAYTTPPEPSTVYHNLAYQPTQEKGPAMDAPSPSPQPPVSKEGEGGPGLPPNYVPHREGHGDSSSPSAGGGGGGDGGGDLKRGSPPPSYSPRVETGTTGNEMRVPKLVKAFSVLSNMPKILSGKKTANAIHCLHGIRFFSMLWIMLGHTYNYGLLSVIDNPTAVNLVDADPMLRRFTFQAIMAGGFTVDTFFVLSGFLVTYLTLKDMAKSKKGVSYWIMFYVHRFWRLTPIYMVVLMVFCCLHTFLGGGPLWPEVLGTAANCKDHWWTNLLYVNNLVHVDSMCMDWTWYLANDMQFYWISPFFLIPLSYLAPLGVVMVLLLMGTGISLAFYFEHKNGGDLVSMNENSGYWDEVYITPWCRVAAYTVGVMLGFLFYRVKRTTLSMLTAVAGWLATWGVGLFLCYITYTKNRDGGQDWTVWQYSAYEAFGRPAWALCVAWIIFACHNNRGGFINSILSWEGFLPLSRLTYSAYLVHPVIMMLHVLSRKSLFYIDDYNIVYLYMGHTVTAYLTAFVFSLVAEAPALNLEKLVFRMR